LKHILEIKEKLGKFIGVYIAKPRHIDSNILAFNTYHLGPGVQVVELQ
jgi:hypothetical protein